MADNRSPPDLANLAIDANEPGAVSKLQLLDIAENFLDACEKCFDPIKEKIRDGGDKEKLEKHHKIFAEWKTEGLSKLENIIMLSDSNVMKKAVWNRVLDIGWDLRRLQERLKIGGETKALLWKFIQKVRNDSGYRNELKEPHAPYDRTDSSEVKILADHITKGLEQVGILSRDLVENKAKAVLDIGVADPNRVKSAVE